ncbi:MAG: TolC family protein, partial [Leadbetterella sp.]
MDKRKIGLIFWILCTYCTARAQGEFTLNQAVQYALTNHPNIKSAQLGRQDAELQISEIKKVGLPQINGQFGFTYNLLIPSQIIEASNFNPEAKPGEVIKLKFGVPWGGQGGIGIEQLIFDATWLVGLRAADTYRLMANQEVEKNNVSIAEMVQKAYYSVLIAEQRADILDLNMARLDSIIYQTEAFRKQGFLEKLDVDRLTVQRNNLDAEKQKITNLIELSYQLLKFQMAYPQSNPIKLSEKLKPEDIKILVSGYTNDFAIENRIEYKQLETSKALTNLNIERLDKGKYPSIGISG